jgi:hypothetical protein
MLMDDPSRRGDNVVSLGELHAYETTTEDERQMLAYAAELDDGFTYDELADAVPDRPKAPQRSGLVPMPEQEPVPEDEIQGYLGSLVRKGLLQRETYDEEEIEKLAELNDEHDGLLHLDEVDEDEYGDVLSQQGAIYTRGKGVHVDEDTEPGRSQFYLTEDGKDILESLE